MKQWMRWHRLWPSNYIVGLLASILQPTLFMLSLSWNREASSLFSIDLQAHLNLVWILEKVAWDPFNLFPPLHHRLSKIAKEELAFPCQDGSPPPNSQSSVEFQAQNILVLVVACILDKKASELKDIENCVVRLESWQDTEKECRWPCVIKQPLAFFRKYFKTWYLVPIYWMAFLLLPFCPEVQASDNMTGGGWSSGKGVPKFSFFLLSSWGERGVWIEEVSTCMEALCVNTNAGKSCFLLIWFFHMNRNFHLPTYYHSVPDEGSVGRGESLRWV